MKDRATRNGGPLNTMAIISNPKEPATSSYTVLRAICIAGERIEVGDTVELTRTQYTEAFAAGKVGPLVAKPAKAKPAKAAPVIEPAPSGTTPGDEPKTDEAKP